MVMTILKVTTQGNSFRVSTNGYEEYWNNVASNKWEATTLHLINTTLGPEKLFIDCGAWIGGTALPAAAKGAYVIAYEPNPVAAEFLRENIALNPGFEKLIDVREVALNAQTGNVKIYNNQWGGYRSSRATIAVQEGAYIVVSGLDIKDAVHEDRWDQASLIKCDIEAAEYYLLPRMAEALGNARPITLIEFHPTYLSGPAHNEAMKDCAKTLCQWPHRTRAEGIFIPIEKSVPLETIINAPYSDPNRGEVINPRVIFSAAAPI
jgi:FkbM family methyltransferase